MWDMETALKRYIQADKAVIIADACHAGGVGSGFVTVVGKFDPAISIGK